MRNEEEWARHIEYMRQYREKNRARDAAKNAERNRIYRRDNAEKLRQYDAARRATNPDEKTPKAIRPIRVDGDVAYVTLTMGYEAIIDAADIHLVGGVSWRANKSRNAVYAAHHKRRDGKRSFITMHRVIVSAPENMSVDHINGDGLDNRRANLRLATNAENMWNMRRPARNTSGYKGVSWNKRISKWKAQIQVKGKIMHLGSFDDPQKAHAAYCDAAARHFGEYARTE